jgi:ABC-type nitrate/sulfonate/bicarbonate transport system ATPase subunit
VTTTAVTDRLNLIRLIPAEGCAPQAPRGAFAEEAKRTRCAGSLRFLLPEGAGGEEWQAMTAATTPRANGADPGPHGLEVRELRRTFPGAGRPLPVLDGVELTAAAGEFVTLIGPSGCGKSTLFTILAGLDEPDGGTVALGAGGGARAGRLGRVAYMPQQDLLLPWRTVLDNAILPLEVRGVPRRQARREALALFPEFGLAGFERAYPAALSGGMRQRAAFLRTTLAGGALLLLDEPFGALDALTRARMQEWLLAVWARRPRTTLFITHDVEEALFLADRVYVMTPRPGRVALELPVALPRPRDPAVVTTPAFVRLKATLLATLRGEAEDGGARAEGRRPSSHRELVSTTGD